MSITTRGGNGSRTASTTARSGPSWATRRPSTTVAQRQRDTLEQTTGPGVTDPLRAVQEQNANPEFTGYRAEMAARYVESLQLPPASGKIPGFQLIPNSVAAETGLRGLAAGLEGTEDPWDTLDPAQPQPATGAVDGNTVASFVDGLNGQQKDDVLLATLFAQLAANARYNRTEDPFNWSNYYADVLGNIGFVHQNSQFRRFESSQARFTMDEVVLKMLAAVLTEDARATLQQSIDAVKELRDDSGALVIFERNSHTVNNGNFMIEPCTVSPGGVVMMSLGSFVFKSTESVTKVLWFSFRGGPNTKVAINRNLCALNQNVFGQIRDTIMTRVVGHITDYVRTIPLAEEPQPQPGGLSGFGDAAGWASLR